MPNPVKPFVIESNTSKFATGAVLWQQDDNGDWHPCGYISHSFDATQWNYEIYDRELLGIVWALETWQHYLQGSSHPTTILSDHKNLTYFRSAQKLNRWQARWSLFLSQFELKLVHVPGSQMVQSDTLSRRSDLCPDDETDNNLTLFSYKPLIQRCTILSLPIWWRTTLSKMQSKHSNLMEPLQLNQHSLIGKSMMDYYSSRTGVTSLIHQAYENGLWNVITILLLLGIPVNSKLLKK